jgi:phenylacetate-CoA ligase
MDSHLLESYWNPILETLPREVLGWLQLKKFREIVTFAYQNSKFHRALYREAGMEPEDIKTLEDVRKVPRVEKSMMRSIQGKDPFPYGDALCVPLEEVTEFRQTSGTTGQPVYQPDTWQDWEWWAEAWSFILYAQGFRKTDRVFIPFGYNIFVAFWAGHYAAEKIGCEVVPGGVLDTAARILKMQELRATAMMATPSYVLTMADTAKNRLGLDPAKDLWVRKILCAGEAGASIPSTRRRMEAAWGAKVYDHVGATEIGAWGFECSEQSGLHINEALFLAEVEDPVSGEPITSPGKKGKLVITALDRRAQPCIRFDSKDLVEWMEGDCPCGRTFRRFKGGVLDRADDITKVKGVLLSPSAIEEVVRGFPELGDEYEVLVTQKGDTDHISLKVEARSGQEGNRENILGRLKDQLRLRTNLHYEIEIHAFQSLPRPEGKARRFKDLRQKKS